MHNLHGVGGVANLSGAHCRFCNLAAVNVDLDGMIANLAAEESLRYVSVKVYVISPGSQLTFSHIRNNGRRSDNQALDTDHLVHVYKSVSNYQSPRIC